MRPCGSFFFFASSFFAFASALMEALVAFGSVWVTGAAVGAITVLCSLDFDLGAEPIIKDKKLV